MARGQGPAPEPLLLPYDAPWCHTSRLRARVCDFVGIARNAGTPTATDGKQRPPPACLLFLQLRARLKCVRHAAAFCL
jgi:hypothetical protein